MFSTNVASRFTQMKHHSGVHLVLYYIYLLKPDALAHLQHGDGDLVLRLDAAHGGDAEQVGQRQEGHAAVLLWTLHRVRLPGCKGLAASICKRHAGEASDPLPRQKFLWQCALIPIKGMPCSSFQAG